jgi:hypothetical protein
LKYGRHITDEKIKNNRVAPMPVNAFNNRNDMIIQNEKITL